MGSGAEYVEQKPARHLHGNENQVVLREALMGQKEKSSASGEQFNSEVQRGGGTSILSSHQPSPIQGSKQPDLAVRVALLGAGGGQRPPEVQSYLNLPMIVLSLDLSCLLCVSCICHNTAQGTPQPILLYLLSFERAVYIHK